MLAAGSFRLHRDSGGSASSDVFCGSPFSQCHVCAWATLMRDVSRVFVDLPIPYLRRVSDNIFRLEPKTGDAWHCCSSTTPAHCWVPLPLSSIWPSSEFLWVSSTRQVRIPRVTQLSWLDRIIWLMMKITRRNRLEWYANILPALFDIEVHDGHSSSRPDTNRTPYINLVYSTIILYPPDEPKRRVVGLSVLDGLESKMSHCVSKFHTYLYSEQRIFSWVVEYSWEVESLAILSRNHEHICMRDLSRSFFVAKRFVWYEIGCTCVTRVFCVYRVNAPVGFNRPTKQSLFSYILVLRATSSLVPC